MCVCVYKCINVRVNVHTHTHTHTHRQCCSKAFGARRAATMFPKLNAIASSVRKVSMLFLFFPLCLDAGPALFFFSPCHLHLHLAAGSDCS
jgi:hypothetical protein